ncbi:carbohydrate-binding module family 50 protein [Aaosphaeria arxii CBS 175.79]|uniref:Carbohydrate-binding module family 50 protein n=1 Tax=Aaosphaeria arxii CBS 175.79 TaxID=1450172 RepID=A0A6A5Y6U6_9PLEO|nr:carbohydrate-binding module family 50 protein [Aaosphaeria arxii CBS 175.79]KAF2020471.1 carbohydrate-binding module family 50 protein [Aaosphaeria arxii CBS 175.79]
MGRWANRDSDEERLPEGFKRIGYDADEQVYYFIETHTGDYYKSSPGNRFGVLSPTSAPPSSVTDAAYVSDDQIKKGHTEAVRLMLPFALLVLCVLFLLFKFVFSSVDAGADGGTQIHCAEGYNAVQIAKGETCWSTGQAYGLGVEELLAIEGNQYIDCDRLQVGQSICVPEK